MLTPAPEDYYLDAVAITTLTEMLNWRLALDFARSSSAATPPLVVAPHLRVSAIIEVGNINMA